MNTQANINDVDFFKELDRQKIKSLGQIMKIQKFRKGTIINKPGDRGTIYIVNNGRIELYEISESGKKFIFSFLKRGRIFGDFDPYISSTIYAEVVEDSELGLIKTEDFNKLLLKEQRLLLMLFKYFFVRLLKIQQVISSIATDDVMNRLIKLLIQIGRPTDPSSTSQYITDKHTHEQLSQMLGVSRQTISTTISQLQKKGLLKRKKKAFLFDKEKLMKIMK